MSASAGHNAPVVGSQQVEFCVGGSEGDGTGGSCEGDGTGGGGQVGASGGQTRRVESQHMGQTGRGLKHATPSGQHSNTVPFSV